MKAIKLTIVALIMACTFQAANAQVRVGVNVGTPPPRRTVIVEHRRPVVVYRRHVYRRPYVRHRVVRERVIRRRVIVRHHRRY
ncbi:MAG: hypothetical protein ABI367_11695 [Mucilaginibacter sp.]